MLRKLHSIPGLIVGIFAIVLAISGAIMAIHPVLERSQAVVPAAGELSVAQLADRIVSHYPGTEQIKRTPSGSVIAYYSNDGSAGAVLINPNTGKAIAPYEPSRFFRWVKDLHRSLMLGDTGRGAVGIVAALMTVVCLAGLLFLVRRQGGWRNLAKPLKGTLAQRLHTQIGRVTVVILVLSALSGTYMSATRFGMLPDASLKEPPFPTVNHDAPRAPVGDLKALRSVDLAQLEELVFPFPDDPQDVYSLRTSRGAGFVDPVTGDLISFTPRTMPSGIYGLIYQLHTGEGLWWLAVILGIGALGVPALSMTGTAIWWRRRRSAPKSVGHSRDDADTVILVGSEGNTTWGFAEALTTALIDGGLRVHLAAMNSLAQSYPKARRMILMTATYGEGDAPASASGFLDRLERMSNDLKLPYAVLGFGDRQFPAFCGFAKDVDHALARKGWPRLIAAEWIDRKNSQVFNRWSRRLGESMGLKLSVNHTPERPATQPMTLLDRESYGEPDSPIFVLRFRPSASGIKNTRVGKTRPFEAGDLIGILPPGSETPRFYSLASSSEDGVAEICVRKHQGGLCSTHLQHLQPGEEIDAFIQPNPDFRPTTGGSPVVLIGAGTGIGPLAGFIRKNGARKPMYLYWGGRNPNSDFLYRDVLTRCLEDKRLSELNTAFSRVEQGHYVQDRLLADASRLRQVINNGGQVLVCGGREMAQGVMTALDEILAPLKLDVSALRAEGRYLEDVY